LQQVYDVMRDSRDFTPAGAVTANGAEEPVYLLAERQP